MLMAVFGGVFHFLSPARNFQCRSRDNAQVPHYTIFPNNGASYHVEVIGCLSPKFWQRAPEEKKAKQ